AERQDLPATPAPRPVSRMSLGLPDSPDPPALFAALDVAGRGQQAEAAQSGVEIHLSDGRDGRGTATGALRDRAQDRPGHRVEAVGRDGGLAGYRRSHGL